MERLVLDDRGTSMATLGAVRVLPPERPERQGLKEPDHKLEMSLGRGLSLRGLDLDLTRPYYPGEVGTLDLYWQATESLEGDYEISLWIADDEADGGQVVLRPPSRPLGDAYPTTDWLPEQTWRALYDFRIPANLDPGGYPVWLTVNEIGSTEQSTQIELGQIPVEGRARRFEVPPISEPYSTNMGGKIRFLGYDLEQEGLQPGGSMGLTLYWQALDAMDTNYTIFVHLLDEDNVIVAQRDSKPVDGEAPTMGWIADEIVADRMRIPLESGIAPGVYALEIGVYDASDGRRLPVLERGQVSGDRILLKEVTIRP
jgi:hypothetical protein